MVEKLREIEENYIRNEALLCDPQVLSDPARLRELTKKQKQTGARTRRLETLDLIRGLTLVSMILYHGMWDFVYLTKTGAGLPGLRDWYAGPRGFFWQQTICWSFILLSGFCVPFSRRILRRGLQVTGAGLAVTAVTLLFMYEERVLFGVLTFLGAAMLLTGSLAVFIILLIRGGLPLWACGLIAVTAGTAAAFAELCSHGGIDTVTCPLTAMAVIVPLAKLLEK